MHVLIAHRGQRFFDAMQRQSKWQQRMLTKASRNTRIGILGLGDIGATIAASLLQFDFQLLGWSRSRKTVPGVKSFAGKDELPQFLAAVRLLRLRLAAHRRYARHHECGFLRQASQGRLCDQCGARRPFDRARFDRGAGFWASVGRGAGCVSDRTFAGGQPDLAPSQDHRHAAYRRHHRSQDGAGLCRRLRGAMRRRPAAGKYRRSSAKAIKAV